MKEITISIALLACLAAPVVAKKSQEVVVHTTPVPNLNQWVELASENITKSLERMNLHHYRVNEGVTYVQFTCDENGKPTNVRTSKSSKDHGLDVAGRVTIRTIKSLHPLFAGAKSGQVFEAAIIVEDDEMELQEHYEAIRERAQQQNAYFAARGIPNPVVSLALATGL